MNMFYIEEKRVYDFCRQTWPEAKGAVFSLAENKEKVLASNFAGVEKFYEYLKPIYELSKKDGEDLGLLADRQAVKFLSVELVDKFFKEQQNKPVRDDLSIQLAYVFAAIGNLKGVTPYTPEELKAAIEGKADYYDDMVFVYSLNQIRIKGNAALYESSLLKLVPAEGTEAVRSQTGWDTAFLQSQVLKTLWYSLNNLSEDGRRLIIQNYFYLAIVCGIPVEKLLNTWLGTGTDSEKFAKKQFVLTVLRDNKEPVPVATDCSAWVGLPDAVSNYTAQLGGDVSSGFTQESFISEGFQDQPGREVFMAWLREVLNITMHLSGQTSV